MLCTATVAVAFLVCRARGVERGRAAAAAVAATRAPGLLQGAVLFYTDVAALLTVLLCMLCARRRMHAAAALVRP